jgi:hypothetical protein
MFSAWIEKLFDDPLDAEPSWPALHEVVRDPSRNFLFNHLGLNEDAKIYLRPDCADLPYTLASVLRVQDGAALRLLEMLAPRRRQGTHLPAMVQLTVPERHRTQRCFRIGFLGHHHYADAPHALALCAHCECPSGRRAAEQRDELATFAMPRHLAALLGRNK